MSQTFSQFKKSFYQRVTDLSVFDCEDYNLVKVVLDGLKVDYVKKEIYNEEIFRPPLFNKIILFAKRIKYHRSIKSSRSKMEAVKLTAPFLLFDNGRVAEDAEGKKVSFYFNRIEDYLGSENCVTLYQSETILKNGTVVLPLFLGTLFNSPSPAEIYFIKNLIKGYKKISGLNVFNKNELNNIRVALNRFYNEYRFWSLLLKDANISVALFDQHYHREGFILALKRKNIKVVELQHGLIAPEDIFYVFPVSIKTVASRSLFPDMIFTFGSYWSQVLKKGCEFKPGQIEVLGMYQESNTIISSEDQSKIDKFLNGGDYILITTQTFLHDYFIEYAKWLSRDLGASGSAVKIIVKTHPSEKISHYVSLHSLANVMIQYVNTEYLLSRCKWHVSCYSTTLYDATKYNCMNFSLLIEPCKDYIDTFIKEKISILINKNENPVLFGQEASNLNFDKKTLFENFDNHKHKLKKLDAA